MLGGPLAQAASAGEPADIGLLDNALAINHADLDPVINVTRRLVDILAERPSLENPVDAFVANSFAFDPDDPNAVARWLTDPLAAGGREILSDGVVDYYRQTVVTLMTMRSPVSIRDTNGELSELAFNWAWDGVPTVPEKEEWPNDPAFGASNVLSLARLGDEQMIGFAQWNGVDFEQFGNPLRSGLYQTDMGVHLWALIPGLPSAAWANASSAIVIDLDELDVQVTAWQTPDKVIDLRDAQLQADIEAKWTAFSDATSAASIADVAATEQGDDDQAGDADAQTVVDDDETGQAEASDDQSGSSAEGDDGSETGQAEAPEGDRIVAPSDAAAGDGNDGGGDVGDDVQTDPEIGGPAVDEPSESGGSSWFRWLLIFGVPVALAVAIVLFLRGRGARSSADPKEWKPIFDDKEDEFMERLVHRGTGETIGPDDRRFEGLVDALLPPPPAIPMPYVVEQNEAMMASVSDEVSPLIEPDDPVAVEPIDQPVAVVAEPPGLDGPGDDTTERLRWFAFLDDPPISSGGWSPVSNGALTMAHTGEVPATVDPDGWSRVFVDLETGGELHQGDPGYDAAVDELGLEPIDQVDPSIELDAQRERERQEYLDRGEAPPPELTRPIGTSDEAGLA